MRIDHGNDLILGMTAHDGSPVVLPRNRRDKHLYVCGATGAGKSKFLENAIRQDILNHSFSGSGLMLIDPHGSLYDSLMSWMALERINAPIVPIDLRRDDWVVSFNMLRERQSANASVVADNIVDAMAHVFGQGGTDQTPLFARWAGNLMLALYENQMTLADAMHL